MNDYDAEIHILRQKEMVQRAARSYPSISHLENGGVRVTYYHLLAEIGERLVTLGYRLQGEIDQLSVAPDLVEPLGFSRNGHSAKY